VIPESFRGGVPLELDGGRCVRARSAGTHDVDPGIHDKPGGERCVAAVQPERARERPAAGR